MTYFFENNLFYFTYFQDDDHGYVAGTAFQGVQKPLESTGKFLN
jgi:hypothetical protein